MAPPAGIEPTVIYDKRNWKSRQQLRFIDSTLPVERLQEEVVRRGGSIDDLTDIHKHLNHLTSIAKVAIDKYTKEYLDPILDQIAAIARETGMTETHIIDYITAESSLERQATGIAALSSTRAMRGTKRWPEVSSQISAAGPERFRHSDYGSESMRLTTACWKSSSRTEC